MIDQSQKNPNSPSTPSIFKDGMKDNTTSLYHMEKLMMEAASGKFPSEWLVVANYDM